jgi:hypothetical protein
MPSGEPTVCINEVAAQSDAATADDEPKPAAEPVEEITVFGHRYLRELRLEVQATREIVYDLFNSQNSKNEYEFREPAPRIATN